MSQKQLPKDVVSGRAISIQQPFVEQILTRKKKYEYRSRPTLIRGRVYLYASLRAGAADRWEGTGFEPGDLPAGLIVGSVEIVDCVYFKEDKLYGYKLAKPKRYRKHIKPKQQPQPVWFFPFGKPK
jgi:hypothetical protein